MTLLRVAFMLLLTAITATTVVVCADGARPTVTLPPSSGNTVVIGRTNKSAGVDTFYGIPFAQPPVGNLRLRAPQPLNYSNASAPSVFNATETPVMACLQWNLTASPQVLSTYTGPQSEDCLTLNVQRPTGLLRQSSSSTASARIPVLVWIYGGSFSTGFTAQFDDVSAVEYSTLIGLPIIHVEINYRLGPLGFLPGRAIKEDGAGNVGLLDQRMALQWVSDNIEAFGGDPNRVTIWGESAGSMSVLDQMLMNDGNNSYNGKSLFRGAIMDSGTIMPAGLIDDPNRQEIFDTVLNGTGCNHTLSGEEQLDCLRSVDSTLLVEAGSNLAPNVSFAYYPHVDGSVLTASPDVLVAQDKYPSIPFITGDQEDEGSGFVNKPGVPHFGTSEVITDFLAYHLYPYSNISTMQHFVDIYQRHSTYDYGCPFHTPDDDPPGSFSAETKRAAAILGDVFFTMLRRSLLLARTDTASSFSPHSAPCWSYVASYDYMRSTLGTAHASDERQIFNFTPPDVAAMSTWEYYLSFVYYLDPNARGNVPYWPPYDPTNRTLLNISRTEVGLFMKDDFREDAYQFLADNIGSFSM